MSNVSSILQKKKLTFMRYVNRCQSSKSTLAVIIPVNIIVFNVGVATSSPPYSTVWTMAVFGVPCRRTNYNNKVWVTVAWYFDHRQSHLTSSEHSPGSSMVTNLLPPRKCGNVVTINLK